MLLVGAISITIATLFSLIALCMFFDTDAKIRKCLFLLQKINSIQPLLESEF